MGSDISTIDVMVVTIQNTLSTGVSQVLFPVCAGLGSLGLLYAAGLTVLRWRYLGR